MLLILKHCSLYLKKEKKGFLYLIRIKKSLFLGHILKIWHLNRILFKLISELKCQTADSCFGLQIVKIMFLKCSHIFCFTAGRPCERYSVVALGAGRSISAKWLCYNGMMVHDCHAIVIARRALLRYEIVLSWYVTRSLQSLLPFSSFFRFLILSINKN